MRVLFSIQTITTRYRPSGAAGSNETVPLSTTPSRISRPHPRLHNRTSPRRPARCVLRSPENPSPQPGWVLAAALLISLGACLRLAAVRTLGPAFHSADVVTEDQALVTTGLYGRLRHPSEAGLLLIALGTAALFSSVGALLITLLVLVPATLRRVHVEDEMLGALFPEHALWKAQVPALLPR